LLNQVLDGKPCNSLPRGFFEPPDKTLSIYVFVFLGLAGELLW